MESNNKYNEFLKYKIELRENNRKKIKIRYNCLEIINLCKDYCFGINVKTNKTNIIKYINKNFGTDYCNNEIKRIIIRYQDRIIYKSRAFYKANKDININIKIIKFKKLKKIKKINELDKFKRDLLYNNKWINFITNEKYLSNTIILNSIIDKFEINIIANIDGPNYIKDKNTNSIKFYYITINNGGKETKTIINNLENSQIDKNSTSKFTFAKEITKGKY